MGMAQGLYWVQLFRCEASTAACIASARRVYEAACGLCGATAARVRHSRTSTCRAVFCGPVRLTAPDVDEALEPVEVAVVLPVQADARDEQADQSEQAGGYTEADEAFPTN
jgi:hypothetical protein